MLSKQQAGLSLIELMIGILVGLIVVAGAVNVFTGNLRSSSQNISLSRLNQDLRAMMDIMARDIRRAGFVTSRPEIAEHAQALRNNPFTVPGDTDVTILNFDGGTNNCILYAYNRDVESNDGTASVETPPAVDTNERLGFRLQSTTGQLQMRRSGTANDDCTNGIWESITEPDVEITALTFNLTSRSLNATAMTPRMQNTNPADDLCNSTDTTCNTCTTGDACIFVRWVDITLAGRLRSDNTIAQTLNQRVRIRNDRFVATMP